MADASSRILIVSSSLTHSISFVERIKAEAAPITPSTDLSDPTNTIPWTISNKYYSALVHFEVHEIKAWSSLLADGIPAVVFVWVHGEPYKEHLQYLAKELAEHDPEVSLAVRVKGSSASITPGSQNEDDEDIDAFLSSLGFEFVDADAVDTHEASGIDERSHGTPGIPRVIDALSTIMWPTMVQSASTTARKSKARELLNWARDEEDHDGLRALVDPSEPEQEVPSSLADKNVKSRMQREMEELERWLEDEETLRATEDPWIVPSSEPDDRSLADPAGTSTSPMSILPPSSGSISSWVSHTSEASAASGFDDDFTVFVSAPPADSRTPTATRAAPSGRSTPDADMLNPTHTGASYRSLGSVSDFGGSAPAEEDIGLPSEDEIRATSARIFGSGLSPNAAAPRPALNRTATARTESPSQATPTAASFAASESFFPDSEDEGDYEMGDFDLSRVLNALQSMKEEISG